MEQYTVTFLPENITVTINEGTKLLQAQYEAGLRAEAPCGGAGTCGKCWLEVVEGSDPGPVLSCQTLVEENLVVSTIVTH